ncbi:MAG: undecaprenyl diphosphate synthase [Candidatus Poriferisodalaceae bacterium]|nr:polyprenyl diphosphate synthase [Acidimicrobiales bacterium]
MTAIRVNALGGSSLRYVIPAALDLNNVPAHVACVMDGNGRWAQMRGLQRTEGHAAGEEALFDAIEGAVEVGIKWLTVYAFSTENWKRPPEEVRFLMAFNESLLVNRSQELHEMNVRIRFIGRRNWRVPKRVLRRIDEATELTKNNTGLTFTIAFNYGGRAEIIDAIKSMIEDDVPANKVDERKLRKYFYDPQMPDVDLMVRTSGEFRISNFLLWENAYSEMVFTETLWPDFRRTHLFDAILVYQERDRRFGGLNR